MLSVDDSSTLECQQVINCNLLHFKKNINLYFNIKDKLLIRKLQTSVHLYFFVFV